MADRESAELFMNIFEHAAAFPTEANVAFAQRMWGKSRGYDFSPYQLGCDDALVLLGLARRVPATDPDDLRDNPEAMTIRYGPEGED